MMKRRGKDKVLSISISSVKNLQLSVEKMRLACCPQKTQIFPKLLHGQDKAPIRHTEYCIIDTTGRLELLK